MQIKTFPQTLSKTNRTHVPKCFTHIYHFPDAISEFVITRENSTNIKHFFGILYTNYNDHIYENEIC